MDDNTDNKLVPFGGASDTAGDVSLYGGYPVDAIPEQYRDTTKYKVCSNGAIVELHPASRFPGRAIVGQVKGGAKSNITRESSQDMHRRRALARARAQSSFRAGMADSSPGSGALGTWRAIGQVQSELALDKDRGLSSTRAAEFVGKASGFLGDERQDSGGSGGADIHISADMARLLVSAIMARREDGG